MAVLIGNICFFDTWFLLANCMELITFNTGVVALALKGSKVPPPQPKKVFKWRSIHQQPIVEGNNHLLFGSSWDCQLWGGLTESSRFFGDLPAHAWRCSPSTRLWVVDPREPVEGAAHILPQTVAHTWGPYGRHLPCQFLGACEEILPRRHLVEMLYRGLLEPPCTEIAKRHLPEVLPAELV
jgi:hypothetical protein